MTKIYDGSRALGLSSLLNCKGVRTGFTICNQVKLKYPGVIAGMVLELLPGKQKVKA